MDDSKRVRLESIVDKTTRDWKKTRYLLSLVIAVAAVSGIFFAASLVRFELLTDAQTVVSILTPLILYSLFIERAVEVFLTVWRGKESDALALAASQEEKRISALKTADRSDLNDLQHRLADYKATTRDVAFVWSFVLGIFISLAGVRALALFVDPTSMSELSTFQLAWFTVLDIFITGALIGGGADGIHKIMTMFIALLDSTKARANARASQ